MATNTPGIKLSGILRRFKEGLPAIEGVESVKYGWPTDNDPGFRTPAIYYGYNGSRWGYMHGRCTTRVGTFDITIVAGAQNMDLAVNQIALLQDRLKDWLRVNEILNNDGNLNDMNSYSALIKSDGPMGVLSNPNRLILKHEVEVGWTERMTSNVGVLSGNGGGYPA